MADVERNGEDGKNKNINCGTIGIGLVGAVLLAMILEGAIHLKDCPYERYIPIYLIVGGCFGVVQSLVTMFFRVRNQRNKKEEDNAKLNPATSIVTAFLIAWSIAGSVWVYRIFNTVTMNDPTAATYCHAEVYWFTFILLTSGYVMLAILFCCCWSIAAVAMCSVAAKQSKESDESNESNESNESPS